MGKASRRKDAKRAAGGEWQIPRAEKGLDWSSRTQRATEARVREAWKAKSPEPKPSRVLLPLYRQADELTATVAEQLAQRAARGETVPPIACRPRCAHCCHSEVTVGAAEVFALKRHVDATFTPEEREALLARTRERNRAKDGMDDDTRANSPAPCPFLVDGLCSAYEARPFSCRSHHSADADACARSLTDPTVPVPVLKGFYRATRPLLLGHLAALQDLGLRVEPLWFSLALEIALTNEKAEDQWLSGADPFRAASKRAYESHVDPAVEEGRGL